MRKLKLEELGRLDVEGYKAAEKSPVVVILDNVRSKANVGSAFRNCDAFRVAKLILCGYTPTPPDRTIAKTALGAEFSVDWEHVQEARTAVEALKAEGFTILSVEQAEGSVLLPDFKRDPDQKFALIFGNEVEGVQNELIDVSDNCLEIPMLGTKHSFNVSVTIGIALYGLIFASGGH